mmetsp:Transcript_15939/g.34643  ORF Transcript_15939/g.34643 Transcript_15939/m.34643 type:complete len:340 (+) Transcript_15939:2060-3079(+)
MCDMSTPPSKNILQAEHLMQFLPLSQTKVWSHREAYRLTNSMVTLRLTLPVVDDMAAVSGDISTRFASESESSSASPFTATFSSFSLLRFSYAECLRLSLVDGAVFTSVRNFESEKCVPSRVCHSSSWSLQYSLSSGRRRRLLGRSGSKTDRPISFILVSRPFSITAPSLSRLSLRVSFKGSKLASTAVSFGGRGTAVPIPDVMAPSPSITGFVFGGGAITSCIFRLAFSAAASSFFFPFSTTAVSVSTLDASPWLSLSEDSESEQGGGGAVQLETRLAVSYQYGVPLPSRNCCQRGFFCEDDADDCRASPSIVAAVRVPLEDVDNGPDCLLGGLEVSK